MNVTDKLAPPKFIAKIRAKMEVENLGVTQLARKVGVSHPTITELITYGKKPSFDTCLALSAWLEQPPLQTLREAGLMPSEPNVNELMEQMVHETQDMPEQDQQEILAYIRLKNNLRKKKK